MRWPWSRPAPVPPMVEGERVTIVHTAVDGTIAYGSAAVTQTARGINMHDMRMHDGTPLVLDVGESVSAVVEAVIEL